MICKTCRKDRPIDDFKRYSRESNSRATRCRHCRAASTRRVARWHENGRRCERCRKLKPCPGEITDIDRSNAGVCKACQRAKARNFQRNWSRDKRASDPDWRRRQIDATIRWQKRNRTYVLDADRRRYVRLRKDPKRVARFNEDARMRYRLLQERKGRQLPPLSEGAYARQYGTGYGRSTVVDAAPLLPLIQHHISMVGGLELARVSKVSIKALERVAKGVQDQISLVTADRLCVAFGLPLSLVYPELA